MVRMGEQMYRAVWQQLAKLKKENRAGDGVEQQYLRLLGEMWVKLSTDERAILVKEGLVDDSGHVK